MMAPTTKPFQAFWACVKGCAIHTLVSTEPSRTKPSEFYVPDIVLVHGLGVSARYLLPTAERLAAHFRVWIPELPGFGDSGRPDRVLNIPEMADCLRDWLDRVGLTRAVFLGNSLGCQVIVDLAVRYPQCVESAVLVSPTMDPRTRTIPWQIWHAFRDLCREPWSLWPIVARDYLATGIRRLYVTLRYSLQDPIESKLPLMKVPTLVIRGGRDTIIPQAWVEEMVALLPEGRLVVIPHGTHALNFSCSEELTQEVGKFQASLVGIRSSSQAS